MVLFTLNNMSFIEFLKTLFLVLWILAGFIIFFDDLTTKDEEEGTIESGSLTQHNTSEMTRVEKVVERVKVKTTLVRSTLTETKPRMPSVRQSDDDEPTTNEFKNIRLFQQPLKVSKDFYRQLNGSLKHEFKELFIDEGAKHVCRDLQYVVDGNNDAFFEYLFNDIYEYRHIISPELFSVLMQELLKLAGQDAQTKSLLLDVGTATAYTQRERQGFLSLVDQWTSLDLELQRTQLKPKHQYVFSYVRRAILLEKQGKIEEAVALVDEALALSLDDRTKGNYQARKQRLVSLLKPKKSVLPLPKPSQTKPTLPPVTQTDLEDDGDENPMEQVVFFPGEIKDRPEFYTSLTDQEKVEFRRYFVDGKDGQLVKGLVYTIQGDNQDFFKRVFNYIYLFRKTLSLSLLTKLTNELVYLSGQDGAIQSLIYETASRTAYYRREDEGCLAQVEAWCLQDLAWQRQRHVTNEYVYSFVRYAILLEKANRIPEALILVEEALSRGLDDRTQGNYPERKVRLLGKMPKTQDQVKEEEPEEEADEAALENIQIFKSEIKERQGFYESLTSDEQEEFDRYYVLPGEQHLAKELQYVKGGQNNTFFMKVFNYIYRYRRLISSGLLIKLADELQSFTQGDPGVQSILYELAIRVAYFRRKDPSFFQVAMLWSERDVSLQKTKLNARDQYVYSFTRLAIILEKQKRYQEALALVEEALSRNLHDKTRTGYQGRKQRILKKMAA